MNFTHKHKQNSGEQNGAHTWNVDLSQTPETNSPNPWALIKPSLSNT